MSHIHECQNCGADIECESTYCSSDTKVWECSACANAENVITDREDFEEDAPEPEEPREPEAWQHYDLYTQAGGTIRGRCSTNDNLDHGIPSEHAEWSVRYKNRADMLKITGGSHVGCSGVNVRVFLDGEEVRK